MTGYPINPKTGQHIDGSKPYCMACKNFGHSGRSFHGCEKKYWNVLQRKKKS